MTKEIPDPSLCKSIEVVLDGTTTKARLYCWDEVPGYIDMVQIILECEVGSFVAQSDRSYFRALVDLRRQLEDIGGKILCYGACRHVYPSSMIEAMGNGEKAYLLTKGKPAVKNDIVDIFDPAKEEDVATISEQEEFYDQWFDSFP